MRAGPRVIGLALALISLAPLAMAAVSASLVRSALARTPRVHRVACARMSTTPVGGSGRVCVVGGGFAGLNAALRLAGMPWESGTKPTITLVDKSDRHVFLPMLYDLVCGDVSEWEVAPRFDELLQGTGVEVVRGEFVDIDPDLRELRVRGPEGGGIEVMPYDRAVLALGGQAARPAVKGALSFRTLDDAINLKFKINSLLKSGVPLVRVLVVGTSYSGLELSTQLARFLGPRRGLVTLVGRGEDVLADGAAGNREASRAALDDAGVEVLLGRSVDLESATRARLTRTGDEGAAPEYVDADLVVWCAGSAPAERTRDLGLALTADGRIAVTDTLQVRGSSDVYAIGDMALCEPLADTDASAQNAQVAVQQADYAAYNVWASLGGKAEMPFRYTKLGEMLAYGTLDASVDAMGLLNIRGLPGATLRRAAYLYRMPTNAHKAKVGFSWAFDAAARAADAVLSAKPPDFTAP